MSGLNVNQNFGHLHRGETLVYQYEYRNGYPMLYLGEVVTMVLAEVAEPAGTREFGGFLLQPAQVFAPQKLDNNV